MALQNHERAHTSAKLMSAEDLFRYNRTRHFLRRIDTLRARGEEFIQNISTRLTELYPDHFHVSNSTRTRLELKFFELKVLIRVEIEIEQDQPGRIRTYLCDDASPPRLQGLDFEYTFDDGGNVNRTMPIEDAAAWFGPNLIEHLKSKKIALLL